MVKHIGRDRLESMPCAMREWLPSGGVLFTTHDDPAEFGTDSARRAQAAALWHLRPERSLDEILEVLRDRSAKLAPVASDFDPDVKEIIEQITQDTNVAHRPARIAHFNGYHPPPVSELTTDLTSDVEDPESRIDMYGNRYREQVVALLHKDVPGIARFQAHVLPLVDHHFHRHDYPRMFERADIDDDLVPAIGGFIGQMLVEHLGGRWIPRRNLIETGVAVGGKVWLPFLRAKHYLSTGADALEHSLTQFYRVAARG